MSDLTGAGEADPSVADPLAATVTRAGDDLTRLVSDFVGRVPAAQHAIVLSTDGRFIAGSAGLPRHDADHLAALASGLNSLARCAGRHLRPSVTPPRLAQPGATQASATQTDVPQSSATQSSATQSSATPASSAFPGLAQRRTGHPGLAQPDFAAPGIDSEAGRGAVRRTLVELVSGFLVVAPAGDEACLAVLCGPGADEATISDEMEPLVARVGEFFTAPDRLPGL